MRRVSLPTFLRDLGADHRALRTLIAASVALFASGLAPRVYAPGLASVQSAVRSNDDSQLLLLLGAVLGAGMLLVGGVLGDADGRRRIMIGALAAMTVTAFAGIVVTDGPLFVVIQFVGVGGASIVLPMALAGVATRYSGIPRATAIGIAYGAYGAAVAAGPVLLTLFGPSGARWPAYLAAVVAAAVALWIARSSWGDLPVRDGADRAVPMATATWAFGIVILTAGLIGFQGEGANLVRGAFSAVGLTLIVGGLVAEGRRRRLDPTRGRVERRAVATALFVGFVIAYAQASVMLQVPIYFQLILGYGPFLAVVATLPFMAALVVAGPIAGILIGKFGPRSLVFMGVLAVGLGSVLIGLILRPGVGYVGFALAFLMIGAGFVIAATVRTAIIFASVPKGLPASAAALNEVSVALGSRAGLVVVTLLVTRLALDSYAASLVGSPPGEVSAAVDSFQNVLVAIGLPQYGALVEGLVPANAEAYAFAYTDAVRTVLLSTGIITLIAAPIAAVALGPRDPLKTVWEHQEERAPRKDPAISS
ncbi:MAG: MFS transporter [Thermomicrobiales bacterium]|nr:MAG: MFS transporter [Thermomicrobiales bacterium]